MKQQAEYGYARKASKDKEAKEQLKALQEAGISPKNIFVDQAVEREQFRQLMDCIQPGDVLVIKSLNQLGYTYNEILNEWTVLAQDMGVHIRVLDMNLLDTSVKRKGISETLVSDIFMQMFSYAAQQERDNIRRKQAEGIAYAKLQGRHLGRPRIPKPLKFDDTYDRWRSGLITAEEAMAQLGLRRSTFERFVRERKEELRKAAEQKGL